MRPSVVALVGPTASGKSALALTLARKTGAWIISCDSMQVYRGLDIGTAKPSLKVRREVPHRLIDCCTLPDRFSAARWAQKAEAAIHEAQEHGAPALIVGGTGLYLRALTEGLSPIPPEDPEVRAWLRKRLAEEGIQALHAELARVDAALAARLAPRDTQRILRALGVFHTTGKPLSQWWREGKTAPRIACRVFVLDPGREALRAAIAQRHRAMLARGWWEEVAWLASLALPADHPAMRAVGYRQMLAHLAGTCSRAEAEEKALVATWRYAKRQRTWFRHQVQAEAWGPKEAIADKLIKALHAACEAC